MKSFLIRLRGIVAGRYALLTPAAWRPVLCPGWEKALCHFAISPAWARASPSCRHPAERQSGQGNTGRNQFCLYSSKAPSASCPTIAGTGSRPAVAAMSLRQRTSDSPVVAPRPPPHLPEGYQPQPDSHPAAFVTHERRGQKPALPAQPGRAPQTLLPPNPAFDMAVTSLLPTRRHPARSGNAGHGTGIAHPARPRDLSPRYPPGSRSRPDVIWTASYCPRWFCAIGAVPASYIYYQDVIATRCDSLPASLSKPKACGGAETALFGTRSAIAVNY